MTSVALVPAPSTLALGAAFAVGGVVLNGVATATTSVSTWGQVHAMAS
jgi:hypothetical protein